ncbi:MAG: endonuclease MutS2 [Anaerolineae bacterium]|nr:endonuclease MutS2 [Anaerolineae bacterium]
MQQKHLNTLEFPKILERLARYTMFSASQALALALQPTPYLTEAQAWQKETTEAERLLAVKPDVGIGGARDVRFLIARARRGAVLLALELLEVRQTLIAARNLKRTITHLALDYPRLADMAGRIEECPNLVNEIGQAIDERGEVKSNASPKLARIRRDLAIAYDRLMERLNRLMSSSQYSRYLQENLITQREGRYVIPLKAEFKGKIQGIVHDQSASGATLFIEPMATVELNNKWRQLQLDETEEINKILAGLSDLVGSQGRFIDHTVNALADLDLALAKAKYAQAIEATEPILFNLKESPANGATPTRAEKQEGLSLPGFNLVSARHPLLDPATVVPIEVYLPENTHMLVITGPNTGGKTVSLKTVGLLAAMAQAGLRIPADEGSALPVFNHIFADIGDEQSIEQSLSTFSSHMTNIVRILAQCDEASLVILDELGAGTDPIEGSALARSILSHLLERRVTTFVATHFSELKAYAHTTNGVANASLEFNLETLAPTYHLRIGLPGASNAFAIAQRLGLPLEIINQAQGLVGEDAQQVEAMLAEIKAQTQAAHHARQLVEAEREEAEKYTRRLEQRLAEIDAERREILDAARADARREIKAAREEIRTLREQAQELLKQPDTSPGATAEETRPAAVEAIEEKLFQLEAEQLAETPPSPGKTKKRSHPGAIDPGDKVFVPSFNTTGEVVAMQNKQVEVQLGRFRTTVPLAEVELRQKAVQQEKVIASSVKLPTVESPGMELDLRGQVSEEALVRLDQYLDQAFSARLPWVRIIHGKGSGVLRQVVRQTLSDHPQVSSYRPGDEGEGGEGVTVAKLAVN